MIINHNIIALNSTNQLKRLNLQKGKNLEKLSSGFRINRAADDAAGLSMSEAMRAQIRGLQRGELNVQDGISMVNTAEGAMSEVHAMLQRIVELTKRAYNDTMSNEDKWKCQEEVDELLGEIQRIGSDTNFNSIQVLQGNPEVKNVRSIHVGASTNTWEETITYKSGELPSWVSYDPVMKVNHGGLGANQQNIDHTTILNMGKTNEKIYGSSPDALGSWTETLDDNYVSVMSFDSLANASSKEDLIAKLKELSGTGFSTTCSTCSQKYSLYITSDEDDLKNDTFLEFEKLPLQNLQQLDITGLIEEANNIPDGADISSYAGSIAGKVVDGIVETMGKVTNHFVEFQKDVSNPNKLLIYDWRDDGFDSEVNRFEGTITTGFLRKGKHTVTVENPARDFEYVTVSNEPVWIQASGAYKDGFDIDLPYVSLDSLHLIPYSVFNRGEYYESMNNGGGISSNDEYEEVTKTITLANYTQVSYPATTNEQGEYIPAHSEWIPDGTYREETYSYTVRKPGSNQDDPRNAVSKYGEPSSIDQALYAIEYLSKERSRMGAYENRMEHTLNANRNTGVNLQDSESRIRDANMAQEMSALVRLNIISQAAQAMSAQANQNPQGILQLLMS